jgi:hypothetical protein
MEIYIDESWKGIFMENEMLCACDDITYDNKKDTIKCDNNFCSFVSNLKLPTSNLRYEVNQHFLCWHHFKTCYNWLSKDFFEEIKIRLKKRYDAIFSILQKRVCDDVAREILAFSERTS